MGLSGFISVSDQWRRTEGQAINPNWIYLFVLGKPLQLIGCGIAAWRVLFATLAPRGRAQRVLSGKVKAGLAAENARILRQGHFEEADVL
jgi:hypothetical protein